MSKPSAMFLARLYESMEEIRTGLGRLPTDAQVRAGRTVRRGPDYVMRVYSAMKSCDSPADYGVEPQA